VRLLWSMVACAVIIMAAVPAYADGDGQPAGTWTNNADRVSKQADIWKTGSGMKLQVTINGQGDSSQAVPSNAFTSTSSVSTGAGSGVTLWQGPSPGGGGGAAARWSGNGSRPGNGGGTDRGYIWESPTGGSNEVVRSGPMSFETGTNAGTNAFGGGAVGGWTFPITDPTQINGAAGNQSVAVTTGWAPVGPVPQIDPWTVARSAESEAPLPRISLKVNPDPGRVALPSWFWLEGYNGGVISWSKTEHASHTECRLNEGVPECQSVDDSVTVNLQATPRLYEWTFGDDVDNYARFDDAQGLGRAYTDPNTPSPVAHAYHMSSINYLQDGGYPLELRVTWAAAFSVNGGGSQGLPDVSQTYAARYQVRQIQSIVEH